MSEVTISLQNVSKSFKRYARPVDRLKEMLLPGRIYVDEFHALRDINLEVLQGETLGIIGQNGAGKSTLLQIITGTLAPTHGAVQVRGRISALLELGSGFNPEFTGQQNVFFNGRILGLSRAQIEQKFDAIAAFADIGDFIDQPVRTYSSGMFVRLAFAVVVNSEPDILIVDEALAVGDIYFQQKCFERLRELRDAGTTLLFVSHDTATVYRLCEKAVLIESGKMILHDKARQVIDLYEARLLKKNDTHSEALEITTETADPSALISDLPETESTLQKSISIEDVAIKLPEINVEFVHLLDENDQQISSIASDRTVQLAIGVMFKQAFDDPHIGFKVRNRTGEVIFETHTFCMGYHIGPVEKGTLLETRFQFRVPLMEGEYTITVGVGDSGVGEHHLTRTLAYIHNTAVLKVLRNKDAGIWSGVVNLAPSVNVHRQAYV
jgi:lipopolysaccharide transport system ATP-binding protein